MKTERSHEILSCSEIVGGANTPYDGGLFTLEIKIPDRWGLLNRCVFVIFGV